MGTKRDAKKGKMNPNKMPGYDADRQMHYMRALHVSDHDMGVMVSYMQPEPSRYAKKYLAQRVRKLEVHEHSFGDEMGYEKLLTDDLDEALVWAKGKPFWYVSNLEEDTALRDDITEWTKHNSIDRKAWGDDSRYYEILAKTLGRTYAKVTKKGDENFGKVGFIGRWDHNCGDVHFGSGKVGSYMAWDLKKIASDC
jgi:hypothetical protein